MILSATLRSLYAPVSDQITRGRNAIFRHVERLPDNIPTHQAMRRPVELSVSRPPDHTWKCPPGRPHTKWMDQLHRDNKKAPVVTLEASHWSRPLESDATVWVDYTLTTTSIHLGRSDCTSLAKPNGTSAGSAVILRAHGCVQQTDAQNIHDNNPNLMAWTDVRLFHRLYFTSYVSSVNK